MRIRSEQGFALLEVIVALMILSVTGLSLLRFSAAVLDDEYRRIASEQQLRAASRVLAAASLLTRSELDLRLGDRRVGEFSVDVQRPEPTLYRIAVSELHSAGSPLLVTVVLRPKEVDP